MSHMSDKLGVMKSSTKEISVRLRPSTCYRNSIRWRKSTHRNEFLFETSIIAQHNRWSHRYIPRRTRRTFNWFKTEIKRLGYRHWYFLKKTLLKFYCQLRTKFFQKPATTPTLNRIEIREWNRHMQRKEPCVKYGYKMEDPEECSANHIVTINELSAIFQTYNRMRMNRSYKKHTMILIMQPDVIKDFSGKW